MSDPDDSFEEEVDDDLVLAYVEQERSSIKAQQVYATASKFDTTHSHSVKRDRKRSQSPSSKLDDGKSVRNMKPRVEAAVVVKTPMSAPKSKVLDVKPALKQEVHDQPVEKDVIWPPSQTFSADAIKRQGSSWTTEIKSRIKSEPVPLQGYKGKTKASAIDIDIKRDEQGNVTGSGKKEITKHLLRTLGQKHNPITNSDLYTRTSHIVSCATGHQVAQRGGAKFSLPETSYFHSRNAKLRQQFTAQAREGLRVAEGTGIMGPGRGSSVGIGGRFGAELSRAKAEEGEHDAVDGTMVQQSNIFTGLTFYLNGYTGPRISDLELKRLIAVHGGDVSYLANSSCTHILITKNLSASKTQKFLDSASSIRGGKRKVVHVDFVLDSVAKCRRLDETPYNVIVNKAQPTLLASLGVAKHSTSPDNLKAKAPPRKVADRQNKVICIDD
ncbi:hypothetical protein NliqN6_6305 [Naganishia liquefaciens]|uniref:BRCT domain-containing protein n=1 Tax=Naganishia liquefaciens TaxID=104408 RepID=A0A8H3YI07_9TREE|nr:hypothetical protein NliqN6_6305 [Naganishia liquefaciens]